MVTLPARIDALATTRVIGADDLGVRLHYQVVGLVVMSVARAKELLFTWALIVQCQHLLDLTLFNRCLWDGHHWLKLLI